MMQSYASAAKLRAAGPFSKAALNAMACYGWPSPRIMIGSNVLLVGLRKLVAFLPCYAARITTPAGTSPVDTRRHRAMRSLRASATIMVLRVPRRAFAVRSRYHNASALPFWNLRKRQAS